VHRTVLWPGSALFQDRRQLFKHPLKRPTMPRRTLISKQLDRECRDRQQKRE
jgi:hypothetical protein